MEGDLKYARHTFKTKKIYFKHTHCFVSCKKKSTTSFTNRKKKKKRLSNVADACVRKKAMKQQIPIERTTKLKV